MSENTDKKRVVIEIDDSTDDEATNTGPASKHARLMENDDNEPAVIEPIKPTKDPFVGVELTEQRTDYVIYVSAVEDSSSKFARGLRKCQENCSHAVHSSCFQMDGTRHVSMWQGKLTDIQASKIHFSESPKELPLEIHLHKGWNPWKAGNYIGVQKATTSKLLALLHQLEGLPSSSGKRSCNHLSLYRRRNVDATLAKPQFARVREALQGYDWGSLQGVTIRIKKVGTPYDECRVLAGM